MFGAVLPHAGDDLGQQVLASAIFFVEGHRVFAGPGVAILIKRTILVGEVVAVGRTSRKAVSTDIAGHIGERERAHDRWSRDNGRTGVVDRIVTAQTGGGRW